ncbi:MAG: FKBP-type peptidyl-prolyl cis-trans isomerase [Alphaproteobacteria bacterium]|nr:FKBP-type peptidyl-prolyl cis-trans isomerase [Alphaproteobacteria bacterium]MBV9372236.1 FKBP-type peptidyl-prolyl cis-trans isomerase [Alphaproteobacteria bacterium]MBV9901653.1 FKBP-type peptidyl-prolyl cis-trans isomerase [Alphaproteobacteria bacterium]
MFILALLLAAAATPAKARPAPPPHSFIPPVSPRAVVATPSGVRIETLRPGSGSKPTVSDEVLVTYEGHLADGTLFDASARPTVFPVNAVVPGFAEALQLMRKGGRYRIWIPGPLAYGAQGIPGVIPPNAELEFIVTLVDLRAAQAPPQPAPAG